MKLDALEAEKIAHIQTRRALVQASAQLVERDLALALTAIRDRLGIVGEFQITADGSIVVADAPPSEPDTPNA